jgi:uncharacterized protein (DUF302 family)
MSYYFSKTIDADFEETEKKVRNLLKEMGFGILTEADIKAIMKMRLDADFRKYKILGACNPQSAYNALRTEDKIGLMLPCNVIIQEIDKEKTEVAAIDPAASMAVVNNPKLREIAEHIRAKLQKVIELL